MDEYALVVADAGPLVALFRVGQEHLLNIVARRIVVPQVVVDELVAGPLLEPAAVAARSGLPEWMEVAPVQPTPREVAAYNLDPGESAALSEAVASGPAAVLIDESKGRAAAMRLGIPVIGSLGVFLAAKRVGALPRVEPLVRILLETGYFYSAKLVVQVLELAGEAD